MENNENPLIQRELLEIQNQLLQKTKFIDPYTAEVKAKKDKGKKREEKLQEKVEFVNSLKGSDVSIEIMGEWNVIRNDIRQFLFQTNYDFTGGCSNLKSFVLREQEHLISIKEKKGKDSIEYQMISAIVAQAVVLECEAKMIEAEPVKKSYSTYSRNPGGSRDYIEGVAYQRTLKDCLNALANVSSFDLEYQYKYESFVPTYKYFSELGQKAGLEEKKMPTRQKSGCMGVVVLSILLSTTLIILI